MDIINYQWDQQLEWIESDESKLKQIFLNLLSNSYKFTLGGQIIIKAILEDEGINFYVIDTGIGMSNEIKEKILNNYHSGPSIGKDMHSLGLGLTIVQNLVSKIGSNFNISNTNRRTTISYTIPYKKKERILNKNKDNDRKILVKYYLLINLAFKNNNIYS